MDRVRSVRRWVIALALAGALTGTSLALTEGPVQAQEKPGEGGECECTISGTGNYTCETPGSCEAGNFTCTIECE